MRNVGHRQALAAESTEVGASPVPFLDEAVLEASNQTHWENHIGQLETSFQNEPEDVVWANNIWHEIANIAVSESMVNGTAIIDIECRRTLCRIEAWHDTPNAASEYSVWLLQQIAQHLPQATFDHFNQADGSIISTAFFAREGYDLPTDTDGSLE